MEKEEEMEGGTLVPENYQEIVDIKMKFMMADYERCQAAEPSKEEQERIAAQEKAEAEASESESDGEAPEGYEQMPLGDCSDDSFGEFHEGEGELPIDENPEEAKAEPEMLPDAKG